MTRRSDSGLMRDDVALFVADLHAALKKANDQAEAFERGWYLRGDALEALANAADAVGAPLEPTVRLHW